MSNYTNSKETRKSDPKSVLFKPSFLGKIAEDIPASLHLMLILLSVTIPFSLWWFFSTSGAFNPKFLPSPIQVSKAFINLWNQGYIVKDILASFGRVASGFLLAGLVSLPLGIMMGAFAIIRALAEPIIGILRYMPAPAFIPLLIIYLGINEEPKIALIFIGTVFFNTLMIMDAVKFVPKDLIETTYTLGGNRRQILLQVITPYIIPNIIDTFRINMAASWNLVIVAELVAANEGLGKRIELARKFVKTDEIFVCLIILGIMGFTMDLFFRWLLKKYCKWTIEQN